MNRTQVTTWLRAPYPATSWEGVELVEVDPAYVPIILADLEPRKARSLWTSDAAWEAGYDGICKQQEALLLGAREYIARVHFYQMGYPRDVVLAADGFPAVELPEATLIDIRKHLADPGDGTLYNKLTEIANALAAEGPNGELLGELVQELALLLLL